MCFIFNWLQWNVFFKQNYIIQSGLVWTPGLLSGASLKTFKPNMSRLCAVLMVFGGFWMERFPFHFLSVHFRRSCVFFDCAFFLQRSRVTPVQSPYVLNSQRIRHQWNLTRTSRLNTAKMDSWVNGKRMEWWQSPLVRIAVFSIQSQVSDVSIGGYFTNICKYWSVRSCRVPSL